MALNRSFTRVCEELDRRRHVTLGLERIQSLLTLLGNPQRDLRVVQVVGTNGKGTTAVALAAALEETGNSTGAYLSPHVLSYTERMMARGEYVTEGRFATVMDRVMEVADAAEVPASQFELLTAGALELFRETGVAWAVLEAGLGARYDATTAASPEAVVLTNVGMDHTEYLGDTLQEIALEKLASLPRNGVLVLGDENPEIAAIAQRVSEEAGARIVEVSYTDDEPGAGNLTSHSRRNVYLGSRAASVLLKRPFNNELYERVLERVEGVLPGRFEVHERDGVPVVVDGGHNPGGMRAALNAVREKYGQRPLGVVFGVLRDKDIGSMLTALEKEVSCLTLTRPASERAAEPEWISRRYGPKDRQDREARVVEDVEEALNGVVEEMKNVNGVVLLTGSLYTGAPVLEALRAV